MRRFGLGGMSTTTNSGAPAIQFEDFQPISEWKEAELLPPSQSQPQKASLLHIHLPEFKKEQLKVTFVQATRALRVSGERPLSDSKRSRFNVAFAVPNNCDATQIQGKFQDGVLVLTMPQFPSTTPSAASSVPPPVAPQQPVGKDAPPHHPPPPPPPATAVNKQEAPPSKAAPFPPPPQVNDTPNKDITKGKKDDDVKTDPPAAEFKPAPPPLEKEKEGKVPDNNNPIKSEADWQQVSGSAGKKRKQSSSVAAAAAATEELISGSVDDGFDGEGVTSGIKKRKEELAAAAKDTVESASAKIGDIGEKVKESATAVEKSTPSSGKGQLGIKERMNQLVREENRQAVAGMSLAVIAAVAVGAFVIYRYRSSSS